MLDGILDIIRSSLPEALGAIIAALIITLVSWIWIRVRQAKESTSSYHRVGDSVKREGRSTPQLIEKSEGPHHRRGDSAQSRGSKTSKSFDGESEGHLLKIGPFKIGSFSMKAKGDFQEYDGSSEASSEGATIVRTQAGDSKAEIIRSVKNER